MAVASHNFSLLHAAGAADPRSRFQLLSHNQRVPSLETMTRLKLISRRPATTKIYMSSSGQDPAGVPPPSKNNGSRNAWLVGVVLSIAIPSCRSKLLSLKSIKDKFNATVGTVEIITHVVEEVAEEVERVADEIGNTLPDGPLKNVTDFIEVAADRTEKAAEFAGEVIDQVQAMEEEVSSYIESTILPRRRQSASGKTAEYHENPNKGNETLP